MKSVLISILPKWCELIASGKKTVEVRKTAPKLETPFKCYIDETKAKRDQSYYNVYHEKTIGKVIGEFVCDRIKKIDDYTVGIGRIEHYLLCGGALEGTCLTGEEIYDYGKGKTLYGWHISDLKIYETPKELGEFYTICTEPPTEITCRNCPNKAEFCFNKKKPLTRPPQSWCYVEEL